MCTYIPYTNCFGHRLYDRWVGFFWKYIPRTQRSPQAQTTQHFPTGLRNNKFITAHAHVILCDFTSAQNCANKLSCAPLCSQTQMSSPEDYPSLNWLWAQHSWQHRGARERTHTPALEHPTMNTVMRTSRNIKDFCWRSIMQFNYVQL